jgi:hypothetical protein
MAPSRAAAAPLLVLLVLLAVTAVAQASHFENEIAAPARRTLLATGEPADASVQAACVQVCFRLKR